MIPIGELATDRVRGLRLACCAPAWKRLLSAAIAALVIYGSPLQAAEFPVSDLVAGQRLKPVFESLVSDHIGAVAVSSERGLLFGANWDTEKVYVWDFK